MGIPCVVLVERTMLQMSSGYAATYVRNGSTEVCEDHPCEG